MEDSPRTLHSSCCSRFFFSFCSSWFFFSKFQHVQTLVIFLTADAILLLYFKFLVYQVLSFRLWAIMMEEKRDRVSWPRNFLRIFFPNIIFVQIIYNKCLPLELCPWVAAMHHWFQWQIKRLLLPSVGSLMNIKVFICAI